jgi:hypothetical protein
MQVISCCDPTDFQRPDEAYQGEVAACQAIGIPTALVSFEALVKDRNPAKAVRHVPRHDSPMPALYRGWMLTPEHYGHLYDALLQQGLYLINDPAAYRHGHYLPESFSVIERHTPRSVWLRTGADLPMDSIMELLRCFGSKPVVVKDYVKSSKHEWHEACFIPSAADRANVEKVVQRFLQIRGDDLNEGLVFREFIEFELLGRHSKSGMPLTKEFRLFFLNGRLIFWTNYWEEGDYEGMSPPLDQLLEVAGKVQSRFFTMDVAKRRDGEWMIVELGDGQVAGLPDHADVTGFYRSLLENWPGQSA